MERNSVNYRVQIIIEPDEGGFHAYCPALKGLHSWGETEQEALQNAKDAAIAYLRSLLKHGDPIPVGVIEEKPRRHPHKRRVHRHVEDLVVAPT